MSAEDEHNGLNFSEHGTTTELVELCRAMDMQMESRDLSVRMPVEPFTEVELIAARHNQIMDSLEEALSHTEAVVSLAKDAIITFVQDTLEILHINPSGQMMFGVQDSLAGAGMRLPDLFAVFEEQDRQNRFWRGETVETLGRKGNGTLFPMQAVITKAGKGQSIFYIGTFRDITDLRERERSLRESELRYRELFENIGVATLMIPGSTRSVATVVDISELRLTQDSLTRQRAYFLQLFDGSSQAIVALDKERRIINVNKGFEQLFGYREEDIRGAAAGEFIVPDDRLEEMELSARRCRAAIRLKRRPGGCTGRAG